MKVRSCLGASGKWALALLWPYLTDPVRRRLIRMGSPTFLVTVGGVVINPDHDLLLLKHRFVRSKLGAWDIPSGVVQRGENPALALIREIHEETSLHATIGQLLSLESAADNWLHFCFVCYVEESSLRLARDEIVDFQWIPLRKLTAPFTELQSMTLEALNDPDHFVVRYTSSGHTA